MGRLIDENELIKGRVGNDPVVIDAKCAPTAYDPERVAARLKALTGEECTLHECGIRSEHCKACIAKKAIEIVKGGGVDGN